MSEKDYHTDNNSFVIYKDWEELVLALGSDEERGRLFLALFSYAKTGKQPVDFSGALLMAFLVMKGAIERDGLKWEEVCAKRAISGSKGGAPKGNQNAKKKQAKQANDFQNKQNNQKQAKQADNDNETETETEKEMESDSVNEKEMDNDNDVASLLTKSQRADLVRLSSVSSVETYISKILDWQSKNGKKCKDVYSTIRKWIEQDKSKTQYSEDTGKSYDMDEYEKFAMNYKFPEFPD